MCTSYLTIKVHHKMDTMMVTQDSLMTLFVSTNGNKWSKAKYRNNWNLNGQKIFEVDNCHLSCDTSK